MRSWDRRQFANGDFGLGRGASDRVYSVPYSTERATKPQGKTALARRVAALLACGFVARRVKEHYGYTPLLAPRHKPKSPATNCIRSRRLVRQAAGPSIGTCPTPPQMQPLSAQYSPPQSPNLFLTNVQDCPHAPKGLSGNKCRNMPQEFCPSARRE